MAVKLIIQCPRKFLDANVDAYTEADAQKWIKEYEDLRAIDPKA